MTKSNGIVNQSEAKCPVWLQRQGEIHWQIKLYVQPGAKHSELIGLHNGMLKVKIASPPVDGAANEAVLAFFAKLLDLRRSEITLLRGLRSRQKVLQLRVAKEPGDFLKQLTAKPGLS